MVTLDGLDEPGRARLLTLAVDQPQDPAQIFELRDRVIRVTAVMNAEDQQAFALIDQGWSPAEVARFLGISRNALDARLSRARNAARARRTP